MNTMQNHATLEITTENLDAVLQSGKPVLLDFWATWCVPCNLIKRSVEKAADLLGEDAIVGLVNVDQQPQIVDRFGVQGTPTFVLLQNGVVLQSFSGMATAGGLANRVRQSIAGPR